MRSLGGMGVNRFFTDPLYEVRNVVAERIAAGDWKPGNALPSEFELARELGVSAATLRKSFDLLEREHLIIRRHGRGTFVSDPTSHDQLTRFSNLSTANGDRILGSLSTVEVAVQAPTESERAIFLLPTRC
jgi:GntR family transcriptional regulator